MPPSACRKKSSATAPDSPIGDTIRVAETPRQASPSKDAPKSPFRRVVDGRITKHQKQALLDNIEVEINQRTRKLRSQVSQQVHALKQRIELRINRIPKKFWKMTLDDLLAQAEGRDVAGPLAGVGGAKAFIGDVRRTSRGEPDKNKDALLKVPKKRSPQKPSASPARLKMPPPSAILPPVKPLTLTDKSNLPPSSSPNRSASRTSPTRSQSPVKGQKSSSRARKPVNSAPNSRPTSRTTARSSTETANTHVSVSTKGTKSSQAKSKATNDSKGLKRGNANNGTGSNSSLKENRVAGVKKDPASKPATGRVLRSRK